METTSDHDLLIELKTTMQLVRNDIQDLKNGTSAQIHDHEVRLRALESQSNRWIGKESLVGGMIGIVASLIAAWIETHK